MSVDLSNTLTPDAAKALLTNAVDWTKYDGERVTSNTVGKIFLAMWGQLYWIPNPSTFDSIFNNWNGIVNSDYLVDNMPQAGTLTPDSFIAVSSNGDAQYLVTLYQKLHIPSPATVTQFNFRSPVKLPHLALDYIPTGPDVG